MLDVYAKFAEEWLAMPVIKGVKTASERFAGAVDTYCIEALMQDGKALQAGTSHFLGQNFAKAFDVLFTNKDNQQEHVWATSWGVSTRLMGALIMTHSDDHGLVLPPKLAPVQVAIVPIAKNGEQLEAINAYVQPMLDALRAKGITVKYDNDDKRKPGWKFAEYLAMSRAIVSEKLHMRLPGPIAADTHYLEFTNAESCVAAVTRLFEDAGKRHALMQAASGYALHHVRPDSLVAESLRRALAWRETNRQAS